MGQSPRFYQGLFFLILLSLTLIQGGATKLHTAPHPFLTGLRVPFFYIY